MKNSILLWGLLTLFSTSLKAESLDILPFTTTTLSDIQQHYKGRPFVLIFWSETCAYCMKELAMFGRLQSQFPEIALLTVSTDSYLDPDSIKTILIDQSQLKLDKTWVFEGASPERIYRAVDKRWRGELPVTYFFDRQQHKIKHLGIVKEPALIAWLTAQRLPQP